MLNVQNLQRSKNVKFFAIKAHLGSGHLNNYNLQQMMKFALTLLGMVAAVKEDGLDAVDAELDLDLEWDEDVVAVVTGIPDAEALAALTEEQRWEGYTYCVLEEDACGDLGEWQAAVEDACLAGSDACGTLVDFFTEVETMEAEIEEAYGSESSDGDDSGDDTDGTGTLSLAQ